MNRYPVLPRLALGDQVDVDRLCESPVRLNAEVSGPRLAESVHYPVSPSRSAR